MVCILVFMRFIHVASSNISLTSVPGVLHCDYSCLLSFVLLIDQTFRLYPVLSIINSVSVIFLNNCFDQLCRQLY